MSDSRTAKKKRYVLSLDLSSKNREIYKLLSKMALAARVQPVKIGDVDTQFFRKVAQTLVNRRESQRNPIEKSCPECGSSEISETQRTFPDSFREGKCNLCKAEWLIKQGSL